LKTPLKALRKMAENARKTLGQILAEEGYSKTTQNKPRRVTDTKGFKIAQTSIIDQMEQEERACIEEMKKKIEKASYAVLARTRRDLRKQIWKGYDRIYADRTPITEVEITIK
jgi:hypothetical protein